MAVRATSSWKVVAGNLVTLPEVVSAEEEWEGEADDAEKCVRLEGEGRGELVLETVPGKVILINISSSSSSTLGDLLGWFYFLSFIMGGGGWTSVYCLSEGSEIRPRRRR